MPRNGGKRLIVVCFSGRNPRKLPIFALAVLALYFCFLNLKLNNTSEVLFLSESDIFGDDPGTAAATPLQGLSHSRDDSTIRRNKPISSPPSLSHYRQLTTSIECRIAWDKERKDFLISSWLAFEAPILIGAIRHRQLSLFQSDIQRETAVQSDDIVYVIFTQAPLVQNNLLDYNSIDWMCSYDNKSFLQKALFVPRNEKKGREHVILVCNSTFVPSRRNQADVGRSSYFDSSPRLLEGIIPTKVSASMGESADARRSVVNANGSGNTSMFQYDLQSLLQCDHLEHLEQLEQGDDKKIHGRKRGETLVGGCLRFRGNFDRAHVPEWIEYHRLLGYQHFWVYINEGWNLTGLYNSSDVTYVPFDIHWPDHASSFAHRYSNNLPDLSQEPASWHCLYTAKKYGYDWITTTDVDEYVYVPKNLSNASLPSRSSSMSSWIDHGSVAASKISPILAFLNHFDPRKYSSLIMNSIPFGSNKFLNHSMATSASSLLSSEEKPLMPLMIDYVWRQKCPLSAYPFERYKQFYNPQKVWSVGVHYCWFASGKGVMNLRLDPQAGLFLAHYKLAQQGVFRKGNKLMVKSLEELQLDTSLHDDYRTRLEDNLRSTEHKLSASS